MRVPPELQTLVCGSLTKADLKKVRLVCKSLDQAAVPFLFDEVFVAASYSDLDVADQIVSRFGSYIRTITLSVVEYGALSKEEFFSHGKFERNNRALERINGHLEHAFEVYCKAQTENLEIMESGELLAKLCLILSKSPNIRKFILTDSGNCDLYNEYELHAHDPWKQDDLCPFKHCKLSVSDHISFYVRPNPPDNITPNPLDLAMLAISAAKSTVTDFAIIHDGNNSFLTKHAFVMTARQSRYFDLQFQNLTKLRLRFSQNAVSSNQGPNPDMVIGKTLSVAVNLESLYMEGDDPIMANYPDYPTIFSGVLGGCRFPKLRSLILVTIDSEEEELLEFLKTSPCLEHLMLERFILIPGSWENVADKIRSTFRLKSVVLDILFGGFPGFEWGDDYIFDQQSVEEFFLRNGQSPFTEESMFRQKEEVYMSWNYADKALNSKKYIQRFH